MQRSEPSNVVASLFLDHPVECVRVFVCGRVYSSNCSHDEKDLQAVGKLTVFKSNNLTTAPSAVITGTAQFSQLGTYVTLASYRNNDVIVASSTAAGKDACLLVFTARCTIVQRAVLRSHVVRLSICPSACDVGGSGPHRLKILESDCANN